MAVGFKIADGFIEIRGEVDQSRLEQTVRRAVDRITRAARTVQLLVDVDRAAAAAKVNGLTRNLPRAARTIQLLVDVDAADLVRKITVAIRSIPRSARTITINVDIDMGAAIAQLLVLQQLLRDLGRLGSSGFGGLGASAAGSVNPIGAVVTAVALVTAGVAAAFAAFTVLPPIIGLVSASLGGLTTTAFGLTGVLGVLALGLRGGVLDAMKEMITTGKAADDTLKKLAPSARSFVLALQPAHQLIQRFGADLQQRLFAGLDRGVRELIDRVGVLGPFLGRVADGLNSIFQGVLATLSSPRQIEMLATIFTSMGNTLDRLMPLVPNVLNTLLRIGQAATPVIERLASKIVELSESFQQWIVRLDESGRLNDFFETAIREGKSLLDVIGGLIIVTGKFLAALFPGVEEGQASMAGLRVKLDEISAWLDRPENVQNIRAIVNGFLAAAKAGFALYNAAIAALDPLIGITQTVADHLGRIPSWLGGFVEEAERLGAAVASWFGDAIETVEMFVGRVPEYLGGLVETVEGWLRSLWAVVSSTAAGLFAAVEAETRTRVEAVVGFFQALPGRIVAGLQALPGQVSNLFWVMFDAVTYAIGYAAGTIVNQFLQMVTGIWQATASLPGIVANVFATAWNAAGTETTARINSIITFISTLPGRAWAAAVGLWDVLSNVFAAAWNRSVEQTTGMINAVVGFLQSLPGRAAGAVSSLWGAMSGAFFSAKDQASGQASATVNNVTGFLASLPGRAGAALSGFAGAVSAGLSSAVGAAVSVGGDIVRGVARGISSGVGWVIDAAKRAANNIIRGFKDALGIGSPSKVAEREVGRWIPPGIGRGIRGGTPALVRDVAATARQALAAGIAGPAAEAVSLSAAAAELAAHLRRGGQVYEDLSFRGMSEAYKRFLHGETTGGDGLAARRLLVPEYHSAAVHRWDDPNTGWWDSNRLASHLETMTRQGAGAGHAVQQTFNVTLDASRVGSLQDLADALNRLPQTARQVAAAAAGRVRLA